MSNNETTVFICVTLHNNLQCVACSTIQVDECVQATRVDQHQLLHQLYQEQLGQAPEFMKELLNRLKTVVVKLATYTRVKKNGGGGKIKEKIPLMP